ncbi:MAG: energy transducer TonB [Proteobacteria bacterium]|nr:energy transducer TonB [Pseudomonadota bacterium]
MTAQQQFDKASAAVAQNHCAEAVQLFEGLAARPGIARNAKVMAAINARRALCLVTLGRFDEATADATSAIAALNANDPVDRGQLVMAHTALGEVAYFAIDYGNATREFTLALGLTSGADRYEPLTWLARSTMFDADARSVDYAAEALKIAEASPDTRKAVLASDHTLHARALLNHGSYAAAYDELQKALKAQGGLTERVTVDEVVTRADLALAAILNKDEDSAREYLAYAGAGHFDHGVFSAGVAMGPPPCGGPADLRPDDAVVVQFGINDSGEVSYAYPIYASRNGPAAAEFARAVAGWSWTPDSVKKIPAFFRLVTRLELHCSMATAHPDVLDILRNDLRGWLDGRHVPPYAEAADKLAAVDAARAELLKRQGENDPLERVPVLLALGNSHFVTPAERLQWNQQARDILAAAGAPLGALTYLDVRLSNGLAHAKYSYRDHRAYLRSLLANPAVAADPQVGNVLRLLIAEEHYGLPPAPDAADLLTAAATDPGLAAQDPLRVGALLRLATLQAAAGNVAAARDSYAKSGLSAQQCSLVDAMPVMRRSGAEMVDFPDEASRWGFDGWVEVEFDIQADGKTANQRTLIAYPPMVFVETALETVRHERYTQTYRPEGGVGCGGKLMRINFESSGP